MLWFSESALVGLNRHTNSFLKIGTGKITPQRKCLSIEGVTAVLFTLPLHCSLVPEAFGKLSCSSQACLLSVSSICLMWLGCLYLSWPGLHAGFLLVKQTNPVFFKKGVHTVFGFYGLTGSSSCSISMAMISSKYLEGTVTI